MKANRQAASHLARAFKLRQPAQRGGRRPGAGRKAVMVFGTAVGDWNRSAIVDTMLSAMTVNPFGRPPFAQPITWSRPKVELAAMLAWQRIADPQGHFSTVVEIIVGGDAKARALAKLERAARAASSSPTWQSCLTQYRRHVIAGGPRDYNDRAKPLHLAIPSL